LPAEDAEEEKASERRSGDEEARESGRERL
jgi:hypothetical protein